jgi:hypothetical protein
MEDQNNAVDFKLGESFPLTPHKGDTAMLDFIDETFSLVVYKTTPTQAEMNAIACGPMELSLLLLPVDPHLFLDAELETGETLQCAFYIKSCPTETQELIFSQGAPMALRIFLVDTPSNRLTAMRTIPFDEDFSASFYLALKGQTLSSYEPVHEGDTAPDAEMKYLPAEGYEYVESHLDVASLKDTMDDSQSGEGAGEEETAEKEIADEAPIEESAAENQPEETNPDLSEDMDSAIRDVLARYPAPKLSGYFCYYCGTPLIEGAHFCYKCGKRQPEH